jgi:MerR family transcriptional regulator, light-induced transcriptional regulator
MSVFGVVSWATYRNDKRMAPKVEEKLGVAAVARRIGVAPATLRTWDRRYGLGPSEHIDGQRRRYCPKDLAKLTLMRRLIISGVATADAAEQAKRFKGIAEIKAMVQEFEVHQDVVDALYKALKALDCQFIETTLSNEIEVYGIERAWSDVIVPTLFLIGQEWEKFNKGIETEHLFSEILTRTFNSLIIPLEKPLNARPILLAAVGEELHSLPLYVLAAALCERNIESSVLGARTPIEALSSMVTRTAPPVIFLWAQLSQNAEAKFWREIPSIRPAPRVILGGPGWDEVDCTSVTRADGLGHACEQIEQALGA